MHAHKAHTFSVSFDGPALRNHAIDVQDLAPALLGLGDLIREVNDEFNHGRSKVHLFVDTNFERKCFSAVLQVVQSGIDFVVSLLHDDTVRTSKELLEWIGICKGVADEAAPKIVTLIDYWRLKNGRKVENVTSIRNDNSTVLFREKELLSIDGNHNIVSIDNPDSGSVRINGDNNSITVTNHVLKLGESKKVASAALKAFPITEDSIEQYEISSSDGGIILSPKEFAPIRASLEQVCNGDPIDTESTDVTAYLTVYAPVFETKAQRWRFKFGDQTIHADITNTTIAQDTISRGSVGVADAYKVKMLVTENTFQNGRSSRDYTIMQVLEYFPAHPQNLLL